VVVSLSAIESYLVQRESLAVQMSLPKNFLLDMFLYFKALNVGASYASHFDTPLCVSA
jgi:hypothetical protein